MTMAAACELRLGQDIAVTDQQMENDVKEAFKNKNKRGLFSLVESLSKKENMRSIILIRWMSQWYEAPPPPPSPIHPSPTSSTSGGDIIPSFNAELLFKVSKIISKMIKAKGQFKANTQYHAMPVARNLLIKIDEAAASNVKKWEYAECLQRIGSNYNELHFYDEAINLSEQAVSIMKDIHPGNYTFKDANANIARAHLALKNFEDAIKYYKVAVKKVPKHGIKLDYRSPKMREEITKRVKDEKAKLEKQGKDAKKGPEKKKN